MDISLNNIKAVVKQIHHVDGLNIVEFDFNSITLSMMSLELNSNIKVGTTVILGAKPSHITIAKNYDIEISYSNRIKTKIINIIEGKLLSSVVMICNDTKIESLITKKTRIKMDLKIEDEVVTLIKSSELFIQEVLND